MTLVDLTALTTERAGTKYQNLHSMSVAELAHAMNENDQQVAAAVNREMKTIVAAIEQIVPRMKLGGRLIYVGAGTSGRLGVLDASECPPTFNAKPGQVVGIIAGGDGALRTSVEGAEDNAELAVEELKKLDISASDTVVAIAASGRTPYCISALDYARSRGCLAVGLSCNKDTELTRHADIGIEIDCGPELLAGSTRMKAGTATKLVLNMISTISMIRLGKVYKNYMVDVQNSNIKLQTRSVNMICAIAEVDADTALFALNAANGSVRKALVMIANDVSLERAEEMLTTTSNDLQYLLRGKLND
jgi:N-acetylmuramic acid 6-phosphate etherase